MSNPHPPAKDQAPGAAALFQAAFGPSSAFEAHRMGTQSGPAPFQLPGPFSRFCDQVFTYPRVPFHLPPSRHPQRASEVPSCRSRFMIRGPSPCASQRLLPPSSALKISKVDQRSLICRPLLPVCSQSRHASPTCYCSRPPSRHTGWTSAVSPAFPFSQSGAEVFPLRQAYP